MGDKTAKGFILQSATKIENSHTAVDLFCKPFLLNTRDMNRVEHVPSRGCRHITAFYYLHKGTQRTRTAFY